LWEREYIFFLRKYSHIELSTPIPSGYTNGQICSLSLKLQNYYYIIIIVDYYYSIEVVTLQAHLLEWLFWPTDEEIDRHLSVTVSTRVSSTSPSTLTVHTFHSCQT